MPDGNRQLNPRQESNYTGAVMIGDDHNYSQPKRQTTACPNHHQTEGISNSETCRRRRHTTATTVRRKS